MGQLEGIEVFFYLEFIQDGLEGEIAQIEGGGAIGNFANAVQGVFLVEGIDFLLEMGNGVVHALLDPGFDGA